jgi:hypothetical protein
MRDPTIRFSLDVVALTKLQEGVHTRFVQKLSLTYYTHNLHR